MSENKGLDKSYFIDSFFNIIDHYNLDNSEVKEVLSLLCFSENRHQSNSGQSNLNYADIMNLDNRFKGVCYNVSATPNKVTISDVSVARLLCDTLYILLLARGEDVSDASFTMPTEVVKSVKKRYGGTAKVSGSREYKDADECKKIMDLFLSSTFNDAEFDDIFKFTSEFLRRFGKLCSIKADRTHNIIPLDYFEKVYLSNRFDNYGFKVSEELPEVVKSKSNSSNLHSNVELWNVMYLMDGILTLFGGRAGSDTDIMAFGARLVRAKKEKSIIPIGIGCNTALRGKLFRPDPVLINSTTRYVYGTVFNADSVLSRNSITSGLDLLGKVYRVEI